MLINPFCSLLSSRLHACASAASKKSLFLHCQAPKGIGGTGRSGPHRPARLYRTERCINGLNNRPCKSQFCTWHVSEEPRARYALLQPSQILFLPGSLVQGPLLDLTTPFSVEDFFFGGGSLHRALASHFVLQNSHQFEADHCVRLSCADLVYARYGSSAIGDALHRSSPSHVQSRATSALAI
jgi:hypothetical protein